MFDELPFWTRWAICICWIIILMWMCWDSGTMLLPMIFGWMGWAFCFKKEMRQGYW